MASFSFSLILGNRSIGITSSNINPSFFKDWFIGQNHHQKQAVVLLRCLKIIGKDEGCYNNNQMSFKISNLKQIDVINETT